LLNDAAARRRTGDERASGPRPTLLGAGIGEGDRVHHEHWGLGTVVALAGEGDRAEAVVRFDDRGDKRLLLAWAPLSRV